MASKSVHQGPAQVVLRFKNASMEYHLHNKGLEEVIPGMYARMRFAGVLPKGAISIVIRYETGEMLGELAFQSINELSIKLFTSNLFDEKHLLYCGAE